MDNLIDTKVLFSNKEQFLVFLKNNVSNIELLTYRRQRPFTVELSIHDETIRFNSWNHKFHIVSVDKLLWVLNEVISNQSFRRKDIAGYGLKPQYSVPLVELILFLSNIDYSGYIKAGSRLPKKNELALHEERIEQKAQDFVEFYSISQEDFIWDILPETKLNFSYEYANELSSPSRIKNKRPVIEEIKGEDITTIKVNFATNREPSKQKTHIFGEKFSENIKYGFAEITIPETHKTGQFEGPKIWKFEFKRNAKDHITLHEYEITDKEMFFTDVLAESENNRKVCIFVHGFNVTFNHALLKAGQLKFDLGLNFPFVLYSWPSHGKLYKYPSDQRNAENSAPVFKKFVEELNECGFNEIFVIAHSMGSLCTSMALGDNDNRHSGLKNLILSAPDICKIGFEQRYRENLTKRFENVTVYSSSTDLALKLSKKYDGSVKLGDSKPEVPIFPSIDTIDATGFKTDGLRHSFYSSSDWVIQDMFNLIVNGLSPKDRFLKQVTGKDGVFWRFKTT